MAGESGRQTGDKWRLRAHDTRRTVGKKVGRGDVESERWGDGMIKTETNPTNSTDSVYSNKDSTIFTAFINFTNF
jgi:hypothetical protein